MYGEQDVFPADENHPTRPLSPYGVAKLAVERYLYFYHAEYGLDATCLRYANVYGPRQSPHGEAGVVAIFLDRLLAGRECTINGDGLQTRDYVFVADVVAANLAAVGRPDFAIFNVGTGVETDVVTLYRHLAAQPASIGPRPTALPSPASSAARPSPRPGSSANSACTRSCRWPRDCARPRRGSPAAPKPDRSRPGRPPCLPDHVRTEPSRGGHSRRRPQSLRSGGDCPLPPGLRPRPRSGQNPSRIVTTRPRAKSRETISMAWTSRSK